jgi:radical SAM protein with 4Fe4S-binding SPASM domain
MTDCSIPLEGLGDFRRRLNNKYQDGRVPLYGTIEVTPNCNLKCLQCYISHCKYDETVLTYPEMCRILDEIAAEGCLWLLLTGGEPFVRNDFLDIYTYAKKKGMFVSIFTNGTLITPEIARYLKVWTPQLVEITIYGATKETYERVTGVAGSYERCLKGIELLVEQGVNLRLKAMLMTINKHEYWEMNKLAESYGQPFRFDPILNPRLDGSREPCELRLTPEEVVHFDLSDPKRVQGWLESMPNLVRLPTSSNRLYTCGAGRLRFSIDAFGKLSQCVIARQPEYNLREGTFSDGWRDFLSKVVNRRLTGPSLCIECKYQALCNVCPGWNLLEYGNLDVQPVEYLCEIARLRAEAFNMENYRAEYQQQVAGK